MYILSSENSWASLSFVPQLIGLCGKKCRETQVEDGKGTSSNHAAKDTEYHMKDF